LAVEGLLSQEELPDVKAFSEEAFSGFNEFMFQ
jgi:hypothetical protein